MGRIEKTVFISYRAPVCQRHSSNFYVEPRGLLNTALTISHLLDLPA